MCRLVALLSDILKALFNVIQTNVSPMSPCLICHRSFRRYFLLASQNLSLVASGISSAMLSTRATISPWLRIVPTRLAALVLKIFLNNAHSDSIEFSSHDCVGMKQTLKCASRSRLTCRDLWLEWLSRTR